MRKYYLDLGFVRVNVESGERENKAVNKTSMLRFMPYYETTLHFDGHGPIALTSRQAGDLIDALRPLLAMQGVVTP